MIITTDLPKDYAQKLILDTDNFAGWEVSKTQTGFYAECEAYDIIASSAEEMVEKLNELGAIIVGWE